MKTENGFTLMEVMVVTGLISMIFALMIGIMLRSDTYFTKGQNMIWEHQEARHIVDAMVRSLRESNPRWNVNGTLYEASISEGSKRIDYYIPVYDDNNSVSSLQKVTYKLNPDDPGELWRKTGIGDYEVVSGMIDDVGFGGSCDCSAADPMNCNSVNSSCPSVRITLSTRRDEGFDLTTDVTMRNRVNLTLSNSTGIEEPEEGEF
jgi:prepilin-type N-terminal cleavage/methylation domain-containing protein